MKKKIDMETRYVLSGGDKDLMKNEDFWDLVAEEDDEITNVKIEEMKKRLQLNPWSKPGPFKMKAYKLFLIFLVLSFLFLVGAIMYGKF